MTSIETLKARIPDHARDLRINLGAIAGATALTQAQAWTVAVACAHTTRERFVIDSIEAAANLPAPALAAARGAAAIMGMNNVYYRFVHFTGEASGYGAMPARLRMQILGNPGIAKLDFELACLACSAITGCEMCVRAHDSSVRELGGTKEMVHEAVRIAAILNGVAVAVSAPA